MDHYIHENSFKNICYVQNNIFKTIISCKVAYVFMNYLDAF